MRKEDLHIVFFGEDTFSNVVLTSLVENRFLVDLVIVPLLDNLAYKKIEITCKNHNIPFYRVPKINSEETYGIVRRTDANLGVIVHLDRLIKQPLLSFPKYGIINLHPALLPDYRGRTPQHWPIINREKETGITIHYIDEKADTGNIILQRHIPLTENMYVSDLQLIWMREYKTIVVDAINRILCNQSTIEQHNLSGRYYDKLQPSQCELAQEMLVADAYALVRGVSLPYQGAKYNNMTIYRAHIKQENEDTSAPIIQFADGDLVVDMYK